MKYYTMEHRGSLEESLITKIKITKHQFYKKLRKYKYEYYCIDERINGIRFIIGNMLKFINQPTWLIIEDNRIKTLAEQKLADMIYEEYKKLSEILKEL